MSRSGYSDNHDQWELIRWRGAVRSAMRGKRGQAFLRELRAGLDELPVKRLIAHEFRTQNGEVCALGCVGVRRGLTMPEVESHDEWDDPVEGMGELFNIAEAMAKEIQYVNDEAHYTSETPEQRFTRVSQWVDAQLRPVAP